MEKSFVFAIYEFLEQVDDYTLLRSTINRMHKAKKIVETYNYCMAVVLKTQSFKYHKMSIDQLTYTSLFKAKKHDLKEHLSIMKKSMKRIEEEMSMIENYDKFDIYDYTLSIIDELRRETEDEIIGIKMQLRR
eukprot:gene7383-11705_t